MIECSICKANNEDRSLYCLECGQRLLPKFQDPGNAANGSASSATANILPAVKQNPYQSSSKLHSPILDSDGPAGRNASAADMPFGAIQSNPPVVNNGRASRNGLHSPLLDGKDYFANPYPDPEANSQAPNEPANRNSDKSRLHSPVLDGPFPGSNNSGYVQEDYNSEDQEYESLRSPLLKAKVPLPETPDPVAPGQTLQSLLGSSTGSFSKAGPEFGSVPVANQITDPPLSVTGINKLKNSSVKNMVSHDSGSKKLAARSSQSLLPADSENLIATNDIPSANKSGFGKVLITFLIFLAIGLKSWYLISLGSNAYSSTPFILDQAGQILIMILVLFVAVNVKN